ncbi:MAG: hypothetical protein IIA87_02295 [Nanoarchaeota archaeon]|nr:hypothetical protein [Nanoarchaeota archaeon]
MEISEILTPYIREIGLEGPIEYELGDGLIGCVFDPEERKHKVFYHSKVDQRSLEEFDPNRPYLANFIHEFCHLRLAEQIDPSFAVIEVIGVDKEKALFYTIENGLVDIWANDLFNTHFPDLFRAHHSNYAGRVRAFIESKTWGHLLPPALPYALGKNTAESRRYELKEVDFRRKLRQAGFTSKTVRSQAGKDLARVFGPAYISRYRIYTIEQLWDHLRRERGEPEPRTMEYISHIAQFLSDVPEIPRSRAEAQELHEEMINGFASIVRLPLNAKLVDQKPRPTWYLG